MVEKFTKHIFVVTIVIMLVVFVTGILVGKNIGSSTEDNIYKSMRSNELNAESFLIEQELFKNLDKNSCNLIRTRLEDLSSELAATGRSLVAPMAKEKLGKENFMLTKRKYHLMQVRAYMLFGKLQETCKISSNVLLFYYGANDTGSKEQGRVLDAVVARYDASVFAVEFNYSKDLNFLEQYYGVNETPFTVVNYHYRHAGLTNYSRIVEDLGQ